MGDALLNMDDRRLTDVSNPKIGACSHEGTVVIKTEPVECDGQEYMLDVIQTKIANNKGPEVVSVKIKTENLEDGLVHASDVTGIERDISDQIKVDSMDENVLENIQIQRTLKKEEKMQQDVSVVIKSENMDDQCALDKMTTTNIKKHRKIHSASNIVMEFDHEENVIVMNENIKFRNKAKPDTGTYSRVCEICDMAFRWPQQLKDHVNFVHEGNSPYTCKICGKSFKESRFLQVHKSVHTEERPHCCKLCPSRFKTRSGLSKHAQIIHEKNNLKFKCEHCSKVFKCKENLVKHFVVHQSEKKFACEICGKKVYHKRSLKDHLLTHSEEKNFHCTDCGMKFKRKHSLKLHRLNHLEVRPYKCDFCDKSFSRNQILKRHLQVHTGDRPYKCDLCDKSFGRSNELKRHLLHVHGEDKPYKCNVCDESFSRNPELKRHTEIHTGNRLYKCQYCERSFVQLKDWQIHEKRHSVEKDFECGVCGKVFVKQSELTDHIRIHTEERPYRCELCPYKAKTQSDLKVHTRVHTGERPYKCEICSYRAKTKSDLKGHVRVHTGERPFKCEICPYRAKRHSALRYHMRAHERKALKALKAEVRENEMDLISESVTKYHKAMRENLDTDSDAEVNKKLPEAVPSRLKFKDRADKMANVKEEIPKDSQLSEGTKRKTKVVTNKEDVNRVKRMLKNEKNKNDQNKMNQGMLEISLLNNCNNEKSLPVFEQKISTLSLTLPQKNLDTDWNRRTQLVLFGNNLFSNDHTRNVTELLNDTLDVIESSSRSTGYSESDHREESVVFNDHMGQEKADKKFSSKNTVFVDNHPEKDTKAALIVKADKFSSLEVDGIIHSGVVVAETDDFVIIKNESFSPPQHDDNSCLAYKS